MFQNVFPFSIYCLLHLIQFKSQEIAKMNDRVQWETLTFFAQGTRMNPPQI